MRTIGRLGAAATAGLLLSGLVGGIASADTKETYLGAAKGHALSLKVGATDLGTFGVSDSSINSALKATATGAGAISPLADTKVTTLVEGADGEQSDSAVGAKVAVPGLENLFALEIGKSESASKIVDGLPTAVSSGQVKALTLDIQNQETLSSTIGSVQTEIQPLLDLLGGTLDSVSDITGVDLAVDDTVDELLTALQTTRTLDIQLGTSTSTVITSGNDVISTAVSEGGRIDILPLGALEPVTGEATPVASIIIGSAKATATYDRLTGKTKDVSFDPAIVTIRINTPTTDAVAGQVTELTGIDPTEIVIAPGTLVEGPIGDTLALTGISGPCSDHAQAICILEGTPFETRVYLAAGRTVTNPDGSVGAEADAVRIHAVKNIAQLNPALDILAGGIDLSLAHAEAGIAGVPAQVTPPELTRELPRTGGFPALPVAALGLFGAAVITRRVLAKAAA